jgi:hypothetical protein
MSAQNTRYRFWKRMGIASGTAMLVAWLSHAYLWDQYLNTRPRFVQADQGRVYALNNHGIIVYLTKEEQFRLSLLAGAAAISGFCVALSVAFAVGKRGGDTGP